MYTLAGTLSEIHAETDQRCRAEDCLAIDISGVVITAVCYYNCEKRSYTMSTFIWSRAIEIRR